MAEMNGPPPQPGSQPASGGVNSGSVTGGFEMVGTSMGIWGGAGPSPPGSTVGGLSMTDITLEQALARMQDLMRENGELRGYLKENNEMMKKQFETLSQWKQKVHDANVLNREKFEQTRALITALRSENEELQAKLRENADKEDSLSGKIKTLETELNTLKTAKAASDQLAYNVVKQAEQQGVEVGEEETQMRETVYVASADKEERILELEDQVSKLTAELEQMRERSGNLEHDNVQFRSNTEHLLKDLESTQQLKQQIQKENQDLRQETVELRQQLQSMLAETKNSLQRHQSTPLVTLHHLTQPRDGQAEEGTKIPISGNTSQDGSMGRTPDGTIDDWQATSAMVTAEVERLRKQLEEEKQKENKLTADLAAKELEVSQLQGQIHLKTSELEALQTQHEEQVQQLQREHECHLQQLEHQKTEDSSFQQQGLTATHAEDVQTLRSQVLTLINEVHETQNKLAAAQRTIEGKSARIKELESYSAQVVNESRHQLQQLQQALAMGERQLLAEQQDHGATKQQMKELRKSFNQLVSDYKEVLDTFDQYKAEQEQRMQSNPQQRQQMETINHLTAQVVAAEEAINMREERIKKLKQEVREKEETMTVLQAQAEVYKSDFMAEREARSNLVTEKERLGQELEAEQLKNQGLTDQLTRYTQQQLQDMQLRASQGSSGPHHHPHLNFPPAPRPAPYPVAGGGDGGGVANFPQGPAAAATTGSFNNLSMAEGGMRPLFGVAGAPSSARGPNFQRGPNFPAAVQQYSRGQGVGAEQYQGAMGGYHMGGVVDPRMQASSIVAQRDISDPMFDVHGQQQHLQGGGGSRGGGGGGAQPGQHEEEEQQLYICPSCDQRLPDYDTLAIHVQDCLDQTSQDTSSSQH